METQEVIRIRGVDHPIRPPASLSVALEVYKYAHDMLHNEAAWHRGSAVLLAACCPSLMPGWKWNPRQADALAEQAANALLSIGMSPLAMWNAVQGAGLLKRLSGMMPAFEDEVAEAAKNS